PDRSRGDDRHHAGGRGAAVLAAGKLRLVRDAGAVPDVCRGDRPGPAADGGIRGGRSEGRRLRHAVSHHIRSPAESPAPGDRRRAAGPLCRRSQLVFCAKAPPRQGLRVAKIAFDWYSQGALRGKLGGSQLPSALPLTRGGFVMIRVVTTIFAVVLTVG